MASAVKFAYIKKSSIPAKMNGGLIDAYDYIFTKDTKELFFVNGDLDVIPIRPRISSFDSVDIAETELNKDSSTYEGQWIAIKIDGEYRGYIVNKNASGNFYVAAISSGGSGENGAVKQFDSLTDFPSVGNEEYVYYDKTNCASYVWDNTGIKYCKIGGKITTDDIDIRIIDGGNAVDDN